MRPVIRFSIQQKVFYNLLFLFLIIAGAFALSDMPTERYPNINFGEVVVSTLYPGASPTDVEALITKKIEEELEDVEQIEWVRGTSFPGRSHIRLKFFDDVDYDGLLDEIRFKVLSIQDELPGTIEPPAVAAVTIEDYLPVIVVNLTGNYGNRALSLMAKELKIRLSNIADVQKITLDGEYTREFHLLLDPSKLNRYGVTFDQVSQALKQVNLSIPAGDFQAGDVQYLIKVDQRFQSRQQMVETIIRKDADGSFLRLSELLASAQLHYRDPVTIASLNGQNTVRLKVVKTPEGDAIAIRNQVEAVVELARAARIDNGIDILLTQDSTVPIKDGLSTLGMNLLLGMTMVSLIIWYFMGFRNAALVTIGVPFSFMITMLLMYLTDHSLNEISLFAFVLVTGIVVDDAIVVTENIYRHLGLGDDLSKAIVEGTSEVALPVIASTMTTVAAFLPMLVMTGSTGEFFAQIPIAVSIALMASLIECLLILPIHYHAIGPRPSVSSNRSLGADNRLLAFFRRVTTRVLRLTMNYRFSSLSLVFVAFLLVMAIMAVSISGKIPLVKVKFFPDDYSLYYVDLKGPSSTPIETMDKRIKQISKAIMAGGSGNAVSAQGFAGFYINEDYEPVFGNNYGTVMVTLPSVSEQDFSSPIEHLQQVRQQLKKTFETDGYSVVVHPQKDGPPSGMDINIRVMGDSYPELMAVSEEILEFMNENSQLAGQLIDLGSDLGQPKQFLQFHLDQEKVAEHGLNSEQVLSLSASVLDGRYIGKYRLADEEIDLKLGIDQSTMKQPEEVLAIPLLEHPVKPVLLGDVVTLSRYSEVGQLNRFKGQRTVSVKANLAPNTTISAPVVVAGVKAYFESVASRHPGVLVSFGGEHEDTQRSYQSLSYAFVLAVLAMYLILATQFQSYVQPLIILSTIVFALIGVILGKFVSQSLFTINSFIAIIGVAGVVVNDALVLTDFLNKGYRAGKTRQQAITDAVHARLRPIVLTTLTTMLGLLPMAIGIPNYSVVWGSMASTFVTGLATATLLTLFIVPVQWDLLMGWQERSRKKQRAKEVVDG